MLPVVPGPAVVAGDAIGKGQAVVSASLFVLIAYPPGQRERGAVLSAGLAGSDDPAVQAFFVDALNHGVGRNGISIPVRNRRGAFAVVSFTSNHSKEEWQEYKKKNMIKLQLMSVLIDSAASINLKLNSPPVKLSKREEQCLIWAARGKTYQDISEILNISFGSVKSYLDTARHKLNCINLTHACAVAVATGVIPAKALR